MLCLYLMSAGVICDSVRVCVSERVVMKATEHKCDSKQNAASVDWNWCVIGRVRMPSS